MKKTLHFIHLIKKASITICMLLFLFSSAVGFAQTPTITPTKVVTVAPGVCGALDVELKIQGTNPVVRPLEVVLVIDVSGSMGDGNNPKPLAYAQDAAIDFINKMFDPANDPLGKNRVAIVTYSTTANIRQGLTLAAGKAGLITIINGLSANGSTNIQDGLVKAKTVLDGATYDCATSRSVVLLTDGVPNVTGTNGNSCNSCSGAIQTAANNIKTVTVLGTTYNNQIFSVGLFGAINGTEQTNAETILNGVQSGGSFFTESAANLTGIYTQIFTQLSWVAKSIVGTPFEKETVGSNFIIGAVSVTKGTTTVTGQQIAWNIDFLNVETITLKYRLTPKPNTCGNQQVSTSRLDFQNAICTTTFQDIVSPVTNVPCPIVTIASQTNVKCFGGNNGTITLNTPTGGQGPYTYKWTKNDVDFATTQNISGLTAGTYKVTATDSNNCATGILTIEITQPAGALAIAASSKTDVLCFGANTGSVTAGVVTNSVETVTYSWKNSSNVEVGTTATVLNLPAGTYTVTVTDSCSSKSNNVTIDQPANALAIAVTSKTDVNCYNEITGAIDLTISGGTPNYTYTWKKGGTAIASTSQDLSGVGAGSYEVTVTDSKGCYAVKTIVIDQPANALEIAVTSKTDVNCYNEITGAIDLTISGGTPNYTYTWKKGGTAIASTSQDLSGVGAGSYEVTVTDSKGCYAVKTIVIDQPSNALAIAVTSKTDINCYNEITGAIDLSISGGTPNYTYTWKKAGTTIASTSQDLSGIGAGSYEVTITDSKGCYAVKTIVIDQPANALAIAVTSKTDVNCYNEITGAIDLTISGGTPNYTYTWKKGGTAIASTSQDLSGVGAGSYEVTVTDSKGCYAVKTIVIDQPTNALAIAVTSKTDVNCYNEITGAIDLSISGGTPNYTYTWKKAGTTIASTSQDLSGIGAGSYEVTVTDSKGCYAVKTIVIDQPANALAIAVTSKTDVNCYNEITGAIDLTISGGTPNYTYTWKKAGTAIASTSQDLSGIGAGSYEVTVTDSKGCYAVETIVIDQPTNALEIAVTSKTDVNCYNEITGAIDLTISGGTPNYTYTWKKAGTTIASTSQDLSGIGAGSYEVTVTDSKGCYAVQTIVIDQPANALAITVTSKTDVNCYNEITGAIDLTISGGTPNYTYTWKKAGTTIASTSQDLSGIGAGSYEVTVTDSKGCYAVETIVIDQPTNALEIAVTSKTDVNCYNEITGAIDLTISGGTPNYTYTWKKGGTAIASTSQDLSGIGAGSYEVTVTDSKGCYAVQTIVIDQPASALSCSITQNSAVTSFGLSDGKATVTPIGGNGGYTYKWDNNETTAQAIALSAGLHSVIITDAKGCTTNCSITISQPGVLSCSITQDDPAKCFGDSNGKATVTAIGGNGDYTYAWDNGEVSAQATGLNFGSHTVTVTDKLGYFTTCNIEIGQPQAPLTATITSKTDVKCKGDTTGSATASATGGTITYSYSWNTVPAQNTATATGLKEGTYIVTVTDKNGCIDTEEVIISEPTNPLTASITSKTDVKCKGDASGSATVTATGGTAAYTYSWLPSGGTSATASNLTAGDYTVTITDANLCTTTATVTIEQPNAVVTASITSKTDVNCKGAATGSATASATGGTGTYSYSWNTVPAQNSATANDLTAGTYIVTVTDQNGCTDTEEVTISEPQAPLTASITSKTDVNCKGASTGSATASATGGTATYSYSWNTVPAQNSATANNLIAGTYIVTVTDQKGCTDTEEVIISEPEFALTASIASKTDVKCKGDLTGSATASATGGTGTYSYSWNTVPAQNSATANNLIAGTYIVTVTDQKGCTDTEEVIISEPEFALTASKSQINPGCGSAATGSATVVASGGTTPYSYSWNTNPVQTTATANNLPSGSYTVIITDAKGCKHSESFEILDGDSVLPVINPLPETSTINCPAEPVFAQATATDLNGTISSLTFEDTIVLGNCAGSYTKTRTWTAKDACGNTSLPVSQTIIVQDITAPTWVTQSGTLNKTIECSNQAALAEAQNLFPTATDACDTNVLNIDKVSGQFTASQTCSNAGTYINTWTVKDECGNTSDTFTQVITIQDTTIPTFNGILPENSTVSCEAVPQPAEMTASDNCDSDLPIVFTETKSDIQNQCETNYTLTRKWTTSDCSGNTASYTQIITVRDTTAPTGTAPADVANLQSITDIPVGSPNDITDEADNCSATVNITVSDTNNGGNGCDGGAYILTRTYTLTDCAGNKTELVQTFTVENKVSVTAIGSNVTCQGASDGKITVTSSPGATVIIRNQNNEVVGNSNLPPGTYTVTATAAVNGQNQTCSATTTVVITEPNYKVKISGFIINVDTNTPIANVPVTLIPQGTTPGPILLRITGADGGYSFTGMAAGSYLVQVQDANLNSAYQLYPIDSSLFFTTLEECVFQQHNFEYGASKLPVLGDYVWYDTNGNGIQDEWYDANNDGIITKNVPDGNGAIDYSLWEWIDLNGDGSYAGPQNVGELNAGGFGNALSPNVIVDGPNGYHAEVIVGIAGFWRNRPEQANPYGEYNIKLVRDANFDAVAAALGATGLVKVIPSAAAKKINGKPSKTQMHTVCQTTTDGGYIVNVTPEDLVHLDIDFGVNCKEMKDIIANDDSAGPIAGVNHTTTNVLNVLPNDTLEGVVVTPSDVIITTVTPNEFLQLNPDGSVDVLPNAPVGTLTMVYQICEADETSNCDTATVTITIEAPVMTVTATAICVNDVPYVDYVVTPVNFTPVNGVTIAWANSSNTVITTMTNLPLSGRVLWPGAVVDQAGNGVDWPGWIFENNRWVQGADGFETLRPTVNLTISVNPSETITINYPPADPFCTSRPTFAIIANDDNVGPLSATTAAMPNVISVYTNDTLNDTAVNPSDVTLTTTIADPTGTLTLNPNGTVDVKANTPAGTYTLTYQICENADNGNCDTAIVTVIITAPAPVIANDDTFANIGCNTFGLVGNVLSNDLKGTVPATLQLVNFTLISETTNTKTDPNITIDISGNVNVSSLTPPGTYTYSYRICDKLNAENCDTAVISITVAPLGIINLTSQACNDDSTLIDLLQLLPANTPLTGQWIDTNGTNALQGGILNPFGLALGNYIFEYRIADAVCPRNIAVTMAINDDCKVLPCGNVVVHNAFSPNGDGINDVFEIDNINELTCYPGNTVEIYNRWGILVFETTDYNNSTNAFDGTSRGRTTVKESDGLPTGTYFYIINYKSLDGNNVIQNNKLDGYLYLSK